MLFKSCNFEFWLTSRLILISLLLPQSVYGQVIPDGTTPTPDPGPCIITCTVIGGVVDSTGTNLFHSFEQFSVPDGGSVIFDHSPTLENIFTRVTGSNGSNINGLLRTSVNSDTNLFLLNPNGILFGPNGGLDIGGSFVATTADAIQFGEQGAFSTSDTSTDLSLLTVNPSAFLFAQAVPQSITSQSAVFNSTNFSNGLGVREDKSLLLVGGDIILESSPTSLFGFNFITVPSGQIELGGISSTGVIALDINSNNLSLRYEDDAPLADVSINNSILNVSNSFNNARAGSIVINANSISLIDSSIFSFTSGPEDAGNIAIQADSAVDFQNSTINSSTFDSGAGGSLNISGRLIAFNEGSGLTVSAFDTGDAGKISLSAETVVLDNALINSAAQGNLSNPTGDVGEIQVQTNTLSLENTSRISTSTSGTVVDKETSGLLNIEARDTVFLSDESAITSETFGQRNASDIKIDTTVLAIEDGVISAAVNPNATGQGGTIDIETQVLSLESDAQFTSNTSGEGNAGAILVKNAASVSLSNSLISTETSAAGAGGDIDIGTEQLTLDAGAQISATATATAPASTQSGNVTVNATRINLSGDSTGLLAETQGEALAGFIALDAQDNEKPLTIDFQAGAEISAATSGTGDGGQIRVIAPEALVLSGDGSLSTRSTGPGSAGDVSIQTDGQFRVQDGASVEVSGNSTGDSGTLEVIAATTVLNGGQLLASTQAGEDGNISLQIDDALVLRGESLISAKAFNAANGGNVDITVPFIIALFPAAGSNGNDIEASAVDGDGGRITIQANTLFNIAENIAIDGNMTNDLDASSGTGIDGEVIITTLEVDPDEGTIRLLPSLAEPEISQGCQAGGDVNGQFANAGQGGLSPSPYDALSSEGIQEDIYPPGQTTAQQTGARSTAVAEAASERLNEAKGWNRNAQGNVVLVAENPTYHSSCQRTFNGAS